MNAFEVLLGPEELNPSLCFFSGQLFRWRRMPDGSIVGEEGLNWFHLQPTRNEALLRVLSNASADTFNKLIQSQKSFISLYHDVATRVPSVAFDIESIRGLRLLRPSRWQEPFFSFLCTSNNHLARIQPMVRFLAGFGEVIGQVGENSLYGFPTAGQLSQVSEKTLRDNGFGYRARTIPRVAQIIANEGEEVFFHRLQLLITSDLREELMKLPGVGRKLADCICLYAFHRDDAVPLDTHMWQAICRHLKPEWTGQAMTESRYREAQLAFRSLFPTEAGWAHLLLYYENMIHWRTRRVAI